VVLPPNPAAIRRRLGIAARRVERVACAALDIPDTLAIVAGNGSYPFAMVRGARKAGVKRIVAASFTDETSDRLAPEVDDIEWLRVGQLGKLLTYLEKSGTRHAVMAGQIAPKNLFDLRPDFKALFLLARLKRRNAETIFAAIGEEMQKIGVELLPATTFMDDHLAPAGLIAGLKVKPRTLDDLQFGHDLAKEVSRLDIGQTVLVKNGTVLAVEAFEGTNEAIRRGGALGRGDAVMVKVSKPGQDLRFDVPVIGPVTLETCRDAGVRVIGIEAGRTIILERDRVTALATQHKLSIFGLGA